VAWRAREIDEFEIVDVVERVVVYDVELVDGVSCPSAADRELVERAATLLQLMPGNQRRQTIEDLVAPNDWVRGQRAVDALIDSAFAAEDEYGRLRRLCTHAVERARAEEVAPEFPPRESTAPPREPERVTTLLATASRLARLVASTGR
jgi:hypothetical protein